jgi:hypothetical protein
VGNINKLETPKCGTSKHRVPLEFGLKGLLMRKRFIRGEGEQYFREVK